MQGDAVAIDPIHLGAPPALSAAPGWGERCCVAIRDPVECFTRRYEPRDHREVLYFLPFSFPDSELTCILRRVVSVDVSPESGFPFFIKFLQSLPNLHTLEVRWWDIYDFFGKPLGNALKRVKLPQIKTLIIPLAAHPLLQHCHELEDVNFVVVEGRIVFDAVLRSLASNQNSKIRRLTISFRSWINLSRKWSSTLRRHKAGMLTRHL